MMALLLSSNMNAAGKYAPVGSNTLMKAVDETLASLIQTIPLLERAGQDPKQTAAQFDQVQEKIKDCVDRTSIDGDMSKGIRKSIDLATRQAQWCKEQDEPRYDELAVEFEKRVKLFEKQHEVIARWHKRANVQGFDTSKPIPLMVNCIIADTDEEAIENAKTFIPPFMQQQVDHYEGDKDHFKNLESYKSWSHVFNSMVGKCKPAAMPRWSQFHFVGSPETVCHQLDRYMAAGFGSFLLHIATTGVPRTKRHDWMRRFAKEVAPRYSSNFKG